MTVCSIAVCKAKANQKKEDVLKTVVEALQEYVSSKYKTKEHQVKVSENTSEILHKIYFYDHLLKDNRVLYLSLELDPEEFGHAGYSWNLEKTKNSKSVMDRICKKMKKHGSVKVCYDDSAEDLVFKTFKE